MKYTNLFYFASLNAIGGIESWYYYISKKYKKYDITVIVRYADKKQLKRLQKNIRVILWNGKTQIECENLFINFNREILDYVKADNITFVAHGNYEDMINRNQIRKEVVFEIANDQRINNFIGVSKAVCQAWKNITGKKAECCYNPVILDEPRQLIRICAAQRMSQEKGSQRIERLAKELDKYSIINDCKWHLDIYTDSSEKINNKNITYRETDLNINSYFGHYDWFLSLTDEEGYCYSAVESLLRGTPVIATPCKVFKELGLNETNCIYLEFDCSNIEEVTEKIFNNKLSFKFKVPEDKWDKYIVHRESTYIEERKHMKKIQALRDYIDNNEGRTILCGEIYEVTEERAKEIEDVGYAMILEDPKEEIKAENVEESIEKKVTKGAKNKRRTA